MLSRTRAVDGREVCCYAQDASFLGGSLGSAHAQSVAEMLRLARRARAPVVGFVESAGARMQEGLAGLAGYGRIFREHVRLSGLVPQLAVVCGAAAGGASYGPALNDFVIMSSRARMFLTGPAVVAEVTGEELDAAALGGPRVHERNGVCHLTAAGEVEASLLARDLLDYLPQHCGEPPGVRPRWRRPTTRPTARCRRGRARSTTCASSRARSSTAGRLLEISPRHARNVVCALARLEGRAVGIVASQPRHLGGVLDAAASEKAARFVRTCNAFGLPLVVLVDTPGFLPGLAPGAGGGDQARREARARVRGEHASRA